MPQDSKIRSLVHGYVSEAGLTHGKPAIPRKADPSKKVSERDLEDLIYGIDGGQIRADVYWYTLNRRRSGGFASISIGGSSGPSKRKGGLDKLVELAEEGRLPSKVEQDGKTVTIWAYGLNRQYVIKLK